MVLGNTNYCLTNFSLTRLSLSLAALSRAIQLNNITTTQKLYSSNVYIPLPLYHNTHRLSHDYRFRLFPFRSPLLRESLCFLFLALLRCFSSRRSPSYPMYSDKNILSFTKMGFPIRKSSDQSLIDSSPKLMAVFRLLHRLLMPRHPPNALFN